MCSLLDINVANRVGKGVLTNRCLKLDSQGINVKITSNKKIKNIIYKE